MSIQVINLPAAREARTVGGYVLVAVLAGFTVFLRLFVVDHLVVLGLLWLVTITAAGLLAGTLSALALSLVATALAIWPGVWTEARVPETDWISGLAYLLGTLGITALTRSILQKLGQTRRLRDRLAEQDAILNKVLISVPMMTLDSSGRINRANQAAADLFGADVSTLPGLAIQAIMPAFDPTRAAEPVEGYWQGVRKDGTTFPLNIQHSRVPGVDGVENYALHLIDLTRWHAADAQARELHTQLNKVWRLNSLGEMAATLAHELNQPLSAAATYLHASQADIDRLGAAGENASRTAALAKEQLLRSGQIIRRMRDLLSLEVRSLDRERASSMVDDLSPVLTMIASARGVSIKLDMEGQNDTVRADRIQFQQAIVNLVRNAVEASWSCPCPRVMVCGRAISDTAYEIRVMDNGPGLPPEEVERMFQPMTTTKSGGMGLGLSVTRTIVERHGGRLAVAPSPRGGACFSFNLIRDPVESEP